jgi:two-component system sensor histidine kinase MprB
VSFRTRLVLVAAAAVALAVVASSFVVYFVVKGQLYGAVDNDLRRSADLLAHVPPPEIPRFTSARFNAVGGTTQVVGRRGGTLPSPRVLPVNDDVLSVAKGDRDTIFFNTHAFGDHVRVHVFQYQPVPGLAVEVARSLSATDHALSRIKLLLFLIAGGGVLVAAGLGLAVSGAALAPVRRLTQTTEEVTETRDLSRRIDAGGRDELGRLAGSFNTMLAALEDSAHAQRQLVSDASHELRTPLTSIRANVELLERARDMAPAERADVLASVRGQLQDLTILVGDLVDLARPGERAHEPPEDLRLDELVDDAVQRARRHAPATEFALTAEPCMVSGSRARLARAVGNLLDNAVKWGPAGAPVEVSVSAGEVVVRDHGPGIAQDDLPHVFDRFYRAPAARGLPGSGLGLAIVKHVADAHRGTVVAEPAPGGGTCLRLALPLLQTS